MKFKFFFFSIPSLFFTNCTSTNGETSEVGFFLNMEPEDSLTDPRDGRRYATASLGGTTFMLENLAYQVPFTIDKNGGTRHAWDHVGYCDFIINSPKSSATYYTWIHACNVCPPGWRLPKPAEISNFVKLFFGIDSGEYKNDQIDARIQKNMAQFFLPEAYIRCSDSFVQVKESPYIELWTDSLSTKTLPWGSSSAAVAQLDFFLEIGRLNMVCAYLGGKKIVTPAAAVRCVKDIGYERKRLYAISPPESTDSFMTDVRDGQRYPVKRFGNKVWMRENLRYAMPGAVPAFDYNQNDKLGYLYKMRAAWKACPPGWHLPSEKDWLELELELQFQCDSIYKITGKKIELSDYMKDNGTWGRIGGPSSGFDALPSGFGCFEALQDSPYEEKGKFCYGHEQSPNLNKNEEYKNWAFFHSSDFSHISGHYRLNDHFVYPYVRCFTKDGYWKINDEYHVLESRSKFWTRQSRPFFWVTDRYLLCVRCVKGQNTPLDFSKTYPIYLKGDSDYR